MTKETFEMLKATMVAAALIAASPALAQGSSWTTQSGTTYYQDQHGLSSSYQDRVGQTHVQTYDGRTGTVWRDGGGITHYDGDAFGR
jgi:hypothetical protein